MFDGNKLINQNKNNIQLIESLLTKLGNMDIRL